MCQVEGVVFDLECWGVAAVARGCGGDAGGKVRAMDGLLVTLFCAVFFGLVVEE